MSHPSFVPIVYVKPTCPFSFKVRLFLLEAGLLEGVTLIGTDAITEHTARRILSERFEQISFPTCEITPGEYLQESDAIIARLADAHDIDPTALATFQAYLTGPFKSLMTLFQENKALKTQIG